MNRVSLIISMMICISNTDLIDPSNDCQTRCKIDEPYKLGIGYRPHAIFGQKTDEANKQSLNELRVTLYAEKSSSRKVLEDQNVMWLQLRIMNFQSKGGSFNLAPHFVESDLGYTEEEIPGHQFTVKKVLDEDEVILHAAYWFNLTKESIQKTAQIQAFMTCFCKSYKTLFIQRTPTTFYFRFEPEFDKEIEIPKLTKATYDREDVLIEFQMRKVQGKGRVFIKILGPKLLDSHNDVRGIIKSHDTDNFTGDLLDNVVKIKYDDFGTLGKAQLDFVDKIKSTKADHFEKIYDKSDPYPYLVVAFKCLGPKCSDSSSIPLKNISTD